MEMVKKLIEVSDVAAEITAEEQKKKKAKLSSLEEDFPLVRKSVEVVESVVLNPEPSALLKLFGTEITEDVELKKLAEQAIEAASLFARATNPAAPLLLLEKMKEMEKKEGKQQDESPNLLEDSGLLMNIHYKAHVGSLQQKRQVVEDQETISEHDDDDDDEPFSKMKIAIKKFEAQHDAEQEQKQKQDSKNREFKKASPEKQEKLLEKDMRKAENQSSTTKILNFLESFLSGKLNLMENIENVKSLMEIGQTKREECANELGKQLVDIKERKKKMNAVKKMKKIMKELSDFPNKLRISNKYLLSASEEYSKEKEPFKSCLPQMAKEKLKSCPPEVYEEAFKVEMEKINDAVRTVQTEAVRDALLAPFGMEMNEVPRYEQNFINHYAETFIWDAYDQDMKNRPEFLQGDILLPKSFRDVAFAKFKGEILQLLDQIENEVSKVFYQL